MNSVKRFTLRKEYFGGILHDAKTMVCDILTLSEFAFLKNWLSADEQTIQLINNIGLKDVGDETKKKFESLKMREAITKKNGLWCLENTRLVEQRVVPYGCLTAPIRVYDTFTRRCNLNCPQCCVSSNADFREKRRTLAQTEIIMRKFYEAGTMEWRFTGGEPTSCQDFLDAVAIAKNLGMAVMLNTNGCWNEKQLEKIPASGVNEIIVSIEGREEINDKRRAPGVFKNVLRVMDRITEYNKSNPDDKIKVTINMTIARDNVAEVEYVVRLGARYGYNVNFVPLRPYGRTPTCLPETMLSTQEFTEFTRNVQKLREEPEIRASGIRIIHRNMDLFCPDYPDKSQEPFPFNYSTCGALSTGFGLCPDGRVNACSFMMDDPEFVGPNLLEVSIQDAWLHPKMERFRKATRVGCVSCRFYMHQCEGKCPAMVLAEGGRIENNRLLGKDRYCFAAFMPKQ